MSHVVFLTGGTGYLGARLAARLLARGHEVRTLARPGSEGRLPPGCRIVPGDALDRRTYADAVPPSDTFVHLVGVSHPSPSKAELFRSVDLASAREAVAAATGAGIRHVVYVSVAHPAPVMQAYVATRAEAEGLIRASGLNATILRPWYVLGPGHWWPVVLLPFYGLARLVPATRESARRLGLVTVRQMVEAMVWGAEDPPAGVRVLEVPEIRRRRRGPGVRQRTAQAGSTCAINASNRPAVARRHAVCRNIAREPCDDDHWPPGMRQAILHAQNGGVALANSGPRGRRFF